MNEFMCKQEKIRQLLDDNKLDALLLKRVSSFAWATCGAASYVNSATTLGDSFLLITKNNRFLLSQNNEAPRLEDEELLKAQGWEFRVKRWDSGEDLVSELIKGMRFGADGDHPGALNLSVEIGRLRTQYSIEEQERFRILGKFCAQAMQEAIECVTPGQTEFEIAACLASAAQARGVQPIVNLIATDERVFKYRHPLPTAKTMDRYVMLAMCGRLKGMVCSITRLIYFGKIPDELLKKSDSIIRIDAEMILHTTPGRTLGAMYDDIISFYKKYGYPAEWELHHQGGMMGYEPREFKASPGSIEMIQDGQGFSWNPTIAGVKSEDTILVNGTNQEILTEIPDWPFIIVEIDGKKIKRPLIKEMT